MLVEDDIDDKELFCSILKEISPNITCVTFSNGKDALEYLITSQRLPEIIITDIDMYLMDGKEFIIKLRENERIKDIPAYAYTTPFMFGHVESEIKDNFSGHVFKTVDFNEFEYALRKILCKHNM